MSAHPKTNTSLSNRLTKLTPNMAAILPNMEAHEAKQAFCRSRFACSQLLALRLLSVFAVMITNLVRIKFVG